MKANRKLGHGKFSKAGYFCHPRPRLKQRLTRQNLTQKGKEVNWNNWNNMRNTNRCSVCELGLLPVSLDYQGPITIIE